MNHCAPRYATYREREKYRQTKYDMLMYYYFTLVGLLYVHLVNICVQACDSNEYKSEASVIIFLFAHFEQSQ